LLILFEYLTVSLDKISNKKNYLKNDEFFKFYTVNIKKGPLYTSICREENDRI